jgi:hypothetical protein
LPVEALDVVGLAGSGERTVPTLAGRRFHCKGGSKNGTDFLEEGTQNHLQYYLASDTTLPRLPRRDNAAVSRKQRRRQTKKPALSAGVAIAKQGVKD